MRDTQLNAAEIKIGVVGLGLMGCSITTCLLMAGHPVVAVAPVPADLTFALKRIKKHLQSIDIKKSVYSKIEAVIDKDALLASNTSAIPISLLQQQTAHPSRFFGLHWAEPSHTTRFLEVICGNESDIQKGEQLYKLSHLWGKEPTLVRKDIRGFITNRIMYAMYREAISLVEQGYATVEDVDRACRNNAGYWMTLVGVFRWMDLTGVPAYHTVMKDLFPTLNNSTEVPKLIDDIVKNGGRGTANAHGFHQYTPEEAKLWEETFTAFSYDIRKLALKYPEDVVKKKLKTLQKKNAGLTT